MESKIKLPPYKGQIGELEAEFDKLIGYAPMGVHWKQEYYYREEYIKETKATAPPEIVAELDKIEDKLINLREMREKWEEYDNKINSVYIPKIEKEEIKEVKSLPEKQETSILDNYRLVPIKIAGIETLDYIVMDKKDL